MSQNQNQPMIRIEGLSKIYGTGAAQVAALKNVSLTVNRGDIHGIIGMSGAGKSTLIRCINRLDTPTEGRIFIDGQNVLDLSGKALRDMRKRVSMIFQQFGLLMQKTVEGNVRIPLEIAGVNRREADQRVRELLEIVGLEHKAKAYPAQLSGGQKQRVAIGSALMCGKDLIILDEPTSGLDRYHMEQVGELLRQLASQGKAILVVTHDEELAAGWCDRIVNLGADDSGNNGSHASNPDASSPNPNASTNFATASTHERNAQ